MANNTTISIEVKRYMHDVLIFLRRHRAVAAGITPLATKYFELLARLLAPLHGLAFVTPPLVPLAARKIYRHRISIVSPENERSLLYGSDLAAMELLLKDMSPETILDEVLHMIEVPL